MRKLLLIGLVLLLCACAADAPEIETELPAPTARSSVPFAVSDVTETFSWIGKTPEALGIGEAHLDDSGDILFSGDLFGHTVNGTACLSVDTEDPAQPMRVYEIRFTDDISEMASVESALSVRCGEPYASDTEPYVEANGGETYRRHYWTGEGTATLSNGAKSDFYVFTYSVPAEVPSEVWRRSSGLTTEELGQQTGVYFHFGDEEAEDLQIVETEYDGYRAYRVTFIHQDVPYRVTIVPGAAVLFDEKSAGMQAPETENELAAYRYRISDDGAILYETNAFDALWVVETDEPVKEEDFIAFESFLLNRWLY